MRRIIWPILLTLLLSSQAEAQQPVRNLGFQVPADFEVSLYADDALATDIHSMTIDAHGRVVVASKGYIKILHDTHGVGKADRATVFADFPKSGAHGMYFDGDDLICNGDKGVRRLFDTKGVGKCDKVSDIWFPTKNDGEHAANGIVRGPDGWYYMITGNDAGMGKMHATGPRSPITAPNSGVLLRFSPDGKTQEVLAHGFRNPYDLAFNHLGQVFTVDADGERVYRMPYYAPTRLFDIATGMHHGWLTPGWRGSWSRPAIWPDSVQRTFEIGRGSPTGLIVYRHHAFPERYRNGVFSLCWTFGRLYFFPLEPDGSTYSTKMEVFMRTTGDVGFAPTDMAVGPNGDLFIAIGGRGTRGGVFRVSYKGNRERPRPEGLAAILNADEPLSSWSRARWVPQARRLGKTAFVTASLDRKLSADERIRAVEIMTELFGGLTLDTAQQICGDMDSPDLTARAIWSLSRTAESVETWRFVSSMTRSENPRVARAAWEAVLCTPKVTAVELNSLGWKAGLNSEDRRVRAAALMVINRRFPNEFLVASGGLEQRTAGEKLAVAWINGLKLLDKFPKDASVHRAVFNRCVEICAAERAVPLRMEAVRLLQLALGDIRHEEGPGKSFWGYQAKDLARYEPKLRRETAEKLSKLLPSGDVQLDMELARLLGMLSIDTPGLLERLARRWTRDNSIEHDIHYLLAFSQVPGKRDMAVTRKTAATLNGIQVKFTAQGGRPSDQVPDILEALLERLVQLDANLPQALVDDKAFGNPGHALYASRLPLPQKQAAARKLIARITQLAQVDADEARLAWNPELVRLAGTLPDQEAMPILRARFADPRLTDTAALLLAAKRKPEDRSKFVEVLSSLQPAVVTAAAQAVVALGPTRDKATPAEIGRAVRALRRLEGPKADDKARSALVQLLAFWTGMKQKVAKDTSAPAAWNEWFSKTYPREAEVQGPAGTDFRAWKKRLDKIDWDSGDVRRGEIVFQRKNCFACHGSSRRLGPDLTGIAQRFSRDDLFTAIIDPSKDISPAFVATMITTTSGKSYNGMLIYDSQQLYLLQTTPDTTVRIPGAEVQTIQPSTLSFMPAGLLDDIKEGDLADLYSYLKTLRKK